MSLDQSVQAVPDAEDAQAHPARVEQAVAIGFLAAVSVVMIGWLYVLAVATCNSINWLFS